MLNFEGLSGRPTLSGRAWTGWRVLTNAPAGSALLLLALQPVLFVAMALLGSAILSAFMQNPPQGGLLFPAVALAVALSHVVIAVFGLTILRIRREDFQDIGWGGRPTPEFVLHEALVAAVTLGLLVGFLELVFAPGTRWLTGAPPAFETWFQLDTMSRGGYAIIAIMALAPLVGDSLYRGYALARLAGRFGVAGAVLVSSAFFALTHAILGVQAGLFAFCTGILLSVLFLTLARERLWGLVMGHCLFNALLPAAL